MLEMKCEFDKAVTALAPIHGLKALNPLEETSLIFFFSPPVNGEEIWFFSIALAQNEILPAITRR